MPTASLPGPAVEPAPSSPSVATLATPIAQAQTPTDTYSPAPADPTAGQFGSEGVLPAGQSRPRWVIPAGIGAAALVLIVLVAAGGSNSYCESELEPLRGALSADQQEQFMSLCEAGLWDGGGPAPDYDRETRLQVEQNSVR